jgi:hypothetical protein
VVSQVAGLFLVDHELKGKLLAGFFINWYLLISLDRSWYLYKTILHTYDGEMDVAGVQVEPTPTGDG